MPPDAKRSAALAEVYDILRRRAMEKRSAERLQASQPTAETEGDRAGRSPVQSTTAGAQ